MEASLLAAEALAARAHPDPAEAPGGRIEAGTELGELERVGDWVRVLTPAGDRWWVDGRRLTAVFSPATRIVPPPGEQPQSVSPGSTATRSPPTGPPPGHPVAPVAPSGPDANRSTGRFPRVLAGVVLLAVVLAGIGAVLLLNRSEPTTPEVLRGWFALDVPAGSLTAAYSNDGFFVLADGAVTVGGNYIEGPEFRLDTTGVAGMGDVLAAVGSSHGVLALTSEPAIVSLKVVGQGSLTANRADEALTVGPVVLIVERYPLPAGDYAPAIAADTLIDETVFMFPERDGVSTSFLSLELESGTMGEHRLAEPVEVVSALHRGPDHLFVGHTAGVLVHLWDEDVDGDRCEGPIRSLALADAALADPALAVLRSPSVSPGTDWVAALDRSTDSMVFIDEGVDTRAIAGCHTSVPDVAATIDLGRPVGGDALVVGAYGLDAAYVLTGNGDLLSVDLENLGEARADRVTSIEGLADVGRPTGIALYSGLDSDAYHAFIADGQRLWWVAPDGPEGRDQLDPATVEVRS